MPYPENSIKYYSLSARVLHWGMAALLLSMLFVGLLMVRSLEPWQLTLLALHKSFGVVAFIAVLFRVAVRLSVRPPELPTELSGIQRFIARISHLLLYAAMIALPISGYLMQNSAGRPVEFFGLFSLPPVLPISLDSYGLLRELHGLIALGLIGLVLLHIAAALHHGWVRRDGVLQTMLFQRES
ncbi:cytochrome b [Microbulbifer sp. SA54]|uniref:cytochrome b n=1 Tax=Microbulbifer sp. SA54 TaxID=3401577 RepID=UPI003AB00BF6